MSLIHMLLLKIRPYNTDHCWIISTVPFRLYPDKYGYNIVYKIYYFSLSVHLLPLLDYCLTSSYNSCLSALSTPCLPLALLYSLNLLNGIHCRSPFVVYCLHWKSPLIICFGTRWKIMRSAKYKNWQNCGKAHLPASRKLPWPWFGRYWNARKIRKTSRAVGWPHVYPIK